MQYGVRMVDISCTKCQIAAVGTCARCAGPQCAQHLIVRVKHRYFQNPPWCLECLNVMDTSERRESWEDAQKTYDAMLKSALSKPPEWVFAYDGDSRLGAVRLGRRVRTLYKDRPVRQLVRAHIVSPYDGGTRDRSPTSGWAVTVANNEVEYELTLGEQESLKKGGKAEIVTAVKPFTGYPPFDGNPRFVDYTWVETALGRPG